MAPAAYVAEDGLVWHQREERPFGPVKAQCPSVGKFQGSEVGVGRWGGEHPHRSRRREDGIGGFRGGGKQERG